MKKFILKLLGYNVNEVHNLTVLNKALVEDSERLHDLNGSLTNYSTNLHNELVECREALRQKIKDYDTLVQSTANLNGRIVILEQENNNLKNALDVIKDKAESVDNAIDTVNGYLQEVSDDVDFIIKYDYLGNQED